jgi:hypothetical protein
VYLDLSVDTGDPPQVSPERRKDVRDRLERAGAPQADIDAVIDLLAGATAVPSPKTVFGVVRDGEVLFGDVIPSTPVDPEAVTYDRVPDVTPVVKHALLAFHYLVVETARDGGSVALHRVGRASADHEERVEGEYTGELHKPRRAGGWRNDHLQQHSEEDWKHNQSGLADAVNELVLRYRPRLVVVAGDIRARQLLTEKLSHEARAVLSIEPTDTLPPEASGSALEQHIDAEIERIVRTDEEAISELVSLHEGRGDKLAELTVGGVVHALASAQVDALLIDDGRLGDRELLALDDVPWVATAPEEALTASVIAKVPARLALLRAALLTDARVYYTSEAGLDDDPQGLPEDAPVAALLRWQTGPPNPVAD